MLKVIDISWPISMEITGYKDRKIVQFEEVKNIKKDGARETNIKVSAHTGTHVDAPAHFLHDGITIDEIHLERLVGQCTVIDMTEVKEAITRDELHKYDADIKEDMIILLKTANSFENPTDKFNPHFIYLDASGAQYLQEKKVKAIGIDYLGIERNQQGHPTHEILMKGDVIIIEGLRLGHAPVGHYQFICLPLYVIGLEASPARAILISDI